MTSVVAAGSTWAYRFTNDATPANWAAVDFDAASWATGAGAFGWGHTGLATPLDTTLSPRPITSYYRQPVTLTAVDFTKVTVTTRADDGVVVYVNGVEVARKNLNAGPVTQGTYANAAVSASAAVGTPLVFDVPASAFQVGTNVIAVEVHSNYRSTPSHSFELSAVAS